MWPFETLKNQIMAETKDIGRSWSQKMRYMVKTHGIRGPFRGITAGSISVFLRNGCAIVALQQAQRKFTEWGLRD